MPETLDMVDCAPQRMRLTRQGCARLWTSTQDPKRPPQPHEGRWECRHCPIGAANAGGVVAPAAAALESLALICPRCERATDRIINDWLCVSCYNRHREAMAGRNAKGGRPQLMDRLGTETLVIAGAIFTIAAVASRSEAALVAARRAGKPIIIGVPPLRLASAEGQVLMPFGRPPRRRKRSLSGRCRRPALPLMMQQALPF